MVVLMTLQQVLSERPITQIRGIVVSKKVGLSSLDGS